MEGGRKVTIQRSKGLGENEPDMMNLTTMNPETRRLIKVMPDDAQQNFGNVRFAIGRKFNQEEKAFIAEHGYLYI